MTAPTPYEQPKPLTTARRHVIACATVIEEMQGWLPADVSAEVLDFGPHLRPEKLREMLKARIDATSAGAEVLLLGCGLCSLAVTGLQARSASLVIPRVDDCIVIFLGSSAAYMEQARKEPGTYYLTRGWIEAGDTPFAEHHNLVEKYGAGRAGWMTRLMLKNYRRLAFINTRQDDIESNHENHRRENQRHPQARGAGDCRTRRGLYPGAGQETGRGRLRLAGRQRRDASQPGAGRPGLAD